MKTNNKEQQLETSQMIGNTKEESESDKPIEYFMPEQIEFKFCYMSSFNDGNFAEKIVEESKDE